MFSKTRDEKIKLISLYPELVVPKGETDGLLRHMLGKITTVGILAQRQPASQLELEALAVIRLREEIFKGMAREITERIRNNPMPSEQEGMIGAYRECLEPQVRDAVFNLHAKGYHPRSSGFHAEVSGWRYENKETAPPDLRNLKAQLIQMNPIVVDAATRTAIEAQGAEAVMYGGKCVQIGFEAPEPNIDAMRQRWDAVADAMPAIGSVVVHDNPAGFVMNAYDVGVDVETLARSPFAQNPEGASMINYYRDHHIQQPSW